jgi:putative cardiolipin synthase
MHTGDEYFGATEGVLFVDLDVMAVGPVVHEVSKDFDRYWASGSSYPVDRLLPPVNSALLAELASAASLIERDFAAMAYMNALRNSPFALELVEGSLVLEWVAARMISDDPAKGLGLTPPEALLPQKLHQIIGEPVSGVELVSAYFMPTAVGVDALAADLKREIELEKTQWEAAQKAGVTAYTISPEELARWKKAVVEVDDKYVAGLAAKGYPAKEALDSMRKVVGKK